MGIPPLYCCCYHIQCTCPPLLFKWAKQSVQTMLFQRSTSCQWALIRRQPVPAVASPPSVNPWANSQLTTCKTPLPRTSKPTVRVSLASVRSFGLVVSCLSVLPALFPSAFLSFSFFFFFSFINSFLLCYFLSFFLSFFLSYFLSFFLSFLFSFFLSFLDRLVDLVVKRPPRERKIPGSNPA